MTGKTSAHDDTWPGQTDNLNLELNPCCFPLYVKWNMTGF